MGNVHKVQPKFVRSQECGVRSEMTRVKNLQKVLLNSSYFSLLTFYWFGEHSWRDFSIFSFHHLNKATRK
jgi:hypothetical protein